MSCHFDFLLFYKYSDFSSYRHNCVCLKIGEYYNPSKRDRYIKNNGNMVMLSVSYDTNFGSIFRSGRRKLNNADRSSSLLK